VSTPGSGGFTRWRLCRCSLAGPSTSGETAVVAAGVGLGLAATVFAAAAGGACAGSAAIRYRIAVGTASATSVTEESSITFGPVRRGRSGTGGLPSSPFRGLSCLSGRLAIVRRYEPTARAVRLIRSRSLPGGMASGISLICSALNARSPRLSAQAAQDSRWRASLLANCGVSGNVARSRPLSMSVSSGHRARPSRTAARRTATTGAE
jgi:hypothetical protein